MPVKGLSVIHGFTLGVCSMQKKSTLRLILFGRWLRTVYLQIADSDVTDYLLYVRIASLEFVHRVNYKTTTFRRPYSTSVFRQKRCKQSESLSVVPNCWANLRRGLHLRLLGYCSTFFVPTFIFQFLFWVF